MPLLGVGAARGTLRGENKEVQKGDTSMFVVRSFQPGGWIAVVSVSETIASMSFFVDSPDIFRCGWRA